MKTSIDPVRAEVVARFLLGVTEEMGAALTRTAFSPNIKERMDCSTAVFDQDGNVVALPQRVPIHLGSMVGVVGAILAKFTRASIRPGDMFIANDPYHGGGSHLPDINMIAPVFFGGEIVAFVANIAHHADVGGMVPGSEAAICSSIFQEGLRIPPVRIMKEGVLNQDVLDMVLLNSRTPDERSGDLRAQIAANTVGHRAVVSLFERYGAQELQRTMQGYLDFTERRFAAAIARLPAGRYESHDWLDGNEPGQRARIQLALTIGDGRLRFDFAGSDPQLQTARNIPYRALIATVYTVVKSMLDPEVAANAGYFRTIEIATTPGTVVGPVSPAAIGARALSCAVLGDVIATAISQATPGKALARSGPHQLIVLAGDDPRNGQYFVNYETIAGGMGARSYRHGMDAVRVHASGSSNLPVEALEHTYPFLIERYEMARDSGGAGQYRGGAGVLRDYRVMGTTWW
ncbi:hydantoinase B/oxoprolinase family protein [Xylophilus rhododendri]|uniref:Hydantoinase B/oxoprolinase family protein n=1 Tax=Xylophilus rhododendri TaxID=2697032 RepID=A0A857J3J3_9BURK|nr:hydantoinase B/oxoprolinase family protein [Xylophilus rhododendri]QHI98494.1 hydantoinase B/oxoprolinase family protein [Xylophilus rhododendri]